jgi:hypothetical protein
MSLFPENSADVPLSRSNASDVPFASPSSYFTNWHAAFWSALNGLICHHPPEHPVLSRFGSTCAAHKSFQAPGNQLRALEIVGFGVAVHALQQPNLHRHGDLLCARADSGPALILFDGQR